MNCNKCGKSICWAERNNNNGLCDKCAGEIRNTVNSDLAFWKENLEREKERLKGLLIFSHGVDHSGTMDARRNIKRYENKIKELGND